MRASMALVVVLPFVAETTATPAGSFAASAFRAPGSTFQRSLPGNVVPPPRPTARERRPTRRAADVSALRRTPMASSLAIVARRSDLRVGIQIATSVRALTLGTLRVRPADRRLVPRLGTLRSRL